MDRNHSSSGQDETVSENLPGSGETESTSSATQLPEVSPASARGPADVKQKIRKPQSDTRTSSRVDPRLGPDVRPKTCTRPSADEKDASTPDVTSVSRDKIL